MIQMIQMILDVVVKRVYAGPMQRTKQRRVGATRLLTTRVTPAEAAELAAAAEIANMTVSDLVRDAALGHAWQLKQLRALINAGWSAEQAATFLVRRGTEAIEAPPPPAPATRPSRAKTPATK